MLKIDKVCDHKNGILWPVFCQNKIFWTRKSWISIPSTCLVAGLFMFQVPDVSSDVNNRNMIRNKVELSHASTAQMALSMCSSRYCSTYAPHFFLYFWAVVVFLGFFDFFFLFFHIFSSLRITKEVTTKNMSLNKWKAWPVENSEDVLKIDKKLVTMKIGSCDKFLAKIKFSKPNKAGDERIWNFFWSILIYGTSKSEFVCEN